MEETRSTKRIRGRKPATARRPGRCLELLAKYDASAIDLETVLTALDDYEAVHSPATSFSASNRETLSAAPWKHCPCNICRQLGIHVVLFRGAERNRRRGFHNLWVFYRRVQSLMATGIAVPDNAANTRTALAC